MAASTEPIPLVLEQGRHLRRLAPCPPRPHAAAVAQGRLFVIVAGGRQVLTRVDVFVPRKGGGWRRPATAEARAGLGAVAIGDTIYAVGGGWTAATAFCGAWR